MASLKYDYSDVEAGGGGVQAPPALYKGKIVKVTQRTKKNDQSPANDLEIIVSPGEEYANVWTYAHLENARWKVREFLDAVGLPPKGELTEAKLKKLAGTPVLIKIVGDEGNNDTESPDYRARVKNLFKPVEGGEAGGDTDPDTIEGADYGSWTDQDLKDEIKQRDLTLSGRFTTAKAIALLEANDEESGNEPETEAEEPEANEPGEFDITEYEGYEDFVNWADDDLKAELEEREIKLPGRYSEAKARAAIEEAVAAEVGVEGGDDAPGEDNYDDEEAWPDADLKAEIADRVEQGSKVEPIKGRITRAKAIAWLREDDASEPF